MKVHFMTPYQNLKSLDISLCSSKRNITSNELVSVKVN